VRVLVFGTYQRDYPRNAQVRSCLRRAGISIVERHVDVWDGRRETWSAGVGSFGRLVASEARLALPRATTADAMLVGYPGHADILAAKVAARGIPLVFDPLVSLADTFVGDRGRFRHGSLAARALQRLDRVAFRGADIVVADTAANAAFYGDALDVEPDRLRVCFVGAEDRLFRPGPIRTRPPSGGEFHALFVGKLIPLHGLETILTAAALAPDVAFRVVGSGQLSSLLGNAPPNVACVPWIGYEELPGALRQASCALGIFGTSDKAGRVIPNKAYQALACGTPLVTADTPAARELLTHGVDALLVPPGDAEALASAVRQLAQYPATATLIGAAGRRTYVGAASEEVLSGRWRSLFEELVA
jgi:glycosyltransferase involved in cell wall biosynthesis